MSEQLSFGPENPKEVLRANFVRKFRGQDHGTRDNTFAQNISQERRFGYEGFNAYDPRGYRYEMTPEDQQDLTLHGAVSSIEKDMDSWEFQRNHYDQNDSDFESVMFETYRLPEFSVEETDLLYEEDDQPPTGLSKEALEVALQEAGVTGSLHEWEVARILGGVRKNRKTIDNYDPDPDNDIGEWYDGFHVVDRP